MTKQNYLREFTALFTDVVESEKLLKLQKKTCRDLYNAYLLEPISPKGTSLLLKWSEAMSIYTKYHYTYLRAVRKYRNLKGSFTY